MSTMAMSSMAGTGWKGAAQHLSTPYLQSASKQAGQPPLYGTVAELTKFAHYNDIIIAEDVKLFPIGIYS